MIAAVIPSVINHPDTPDLRPCDGRSWFSRAYVGVVLAIVFICNIPQLFAATPVRFTHFSIEQGLSQATVQAIVQDHVGYLWFGTEEGLNRYDGYGFVVFKHDPLDPGSLPDNGISALYEDRRQRMWVGTQHGLSRYDPRTEKFIPVNAIRDRVANIVESADGTLWVASAGGGLFLLPPKSEAFSSYQPVAKDPGSISSYLISSVLEDRRGRLWIGTSNAGLEMLDRTAGEFGKFFHYRHETADPKSLSSNEVWALAEDKAGAIWAATYGGGLSVLDPDTGQFRHYRYHADAAQGLPTDLITCVRVDREGTVWVGTDGFGILRYDPKTDGFIGFTHQANVSTSLGNNVVRCLYEDTQRQLWVGTFLGGADQMKKIRREFAYYSHNGDEAAGLSDGNIAAFAEAADGSLWVGTELGWLNHFDRTTGAFVHFRYPSVAGAHAPILALHLDRRNRLWVGSYRGGIARFDPATGVFTVYRHLDGDPTSLVNDEVWGIAETDDGLLWLATSAGLECFDPERAVVLEHFAVPKANPELRTVLADQKGQVWVGGAGGLHLIDRRANTTRDFRNDASNPRSLSNHTVLSLQEDHLGRLWVGTLGGGVSLLDQTNGEFRRFDDFPSNVINSIQEDSLGDIWVSTNHGLSRFVPSTGATENFDLANGLQSLQFHLGAGLHLRNGRLLFGSTEGFYDLDPTAIVPSQHAPPVVLTALRIFNQPVKLPVALSQLEELKIAPGDNVFSLEYAALDYVIPRRNHYAYLMEGFDNRWIDMGGKREITFTNLDPGHYVFHVKASNSDGVWTAAAATALRIVVVPPFWRTWWFRSAALGLLGLGLFSAHRVRLNRLTREISERQRAAEAKSNLEAQLFQAQKMEAIGTLAGGIAHDFNNILTGIMGNAELAAMDLSRDHASYERLQHVLQASLRAKNLVQQILTYSRREAQEKRPLQLRTVVEEALKLLRPSLPATVEIRTHFPSPCPPVYADGTQLHQVLMNLATNSAHAMKERGGRLEFGLDVVEVDAEAMRLSPQLRPGRFVRLTVSDTGKGMDAATVRRIFEPFFTTKARGEGTGLGLSVVHGIVQQHSGIILVSSELDQGTTFQVYLPACGDAVVRRGSLPASTPPGHNENIIVIDDEELVLQVTTEILTRLGYRPRSFLDPAAVLLALRQKPTDCAMVITDLTMKRMTGIALAAEIRLILPDVPILICTGFDGVLDDRDLERLALCGPLLKPFTMETLATAVSQALSRP